MLNAGYALMEREKAIANERRKYAKKIRALEAALDEIDAIACYAYPNNDVSREKIIERDAADCASIRKIIRKFKTA